MAEQQSRRRIDQARRQRFVASLFSLFAALGIGLAACGVYGVDASSARPVETSCVQVLREEVAAALADVALGLFMTKYGVRLLSKMAIEDGLFNAPLFATVAVLLIATVAIAAFVPAIRATRIDPTDSLRHE